MSVIVENLTKIYGAQKALDGITFTANKGEILGFLGPNGAGKTTTMKIVTSYIQSDGGEAIVCGVNVKEDTLAAKALIGYLPEHNSLYKDMYVKEYLTFVAGIYKLPNKRQRVSEMIEMTGLGLEAHKYIGALSKGYRQRVGLAQAMIHDPEVLILDEPTSGLDPNQLVEIRGLIKNLGKEKTVIFSTHIMQEVKAICDRVVIVNKGKLVANESIESLGSLVSGLDSIIIQIEGPVTKADFDSIQGVAGVKKDNNRFIISHESHIDIRREVFNLVVKNGGVILEMQKKESSVEDVFQQLTVTHD